MTSFPQATAGAGEVALGIGVVAAASHKAARVTGGFRATEVLHGVVDNFDHAVRLPGPLACHVHASSSKKLIIVPCPFRSSEQPGSTGDPPAERSGFHPIPSCVMTSIWSK